MENPEMELRFWATQVRNATAALKNAQRQFANAAKALNSPKDEPIEIRA